MQWVTLAARDLARATESREPHSPPDIGLIPARVRTGDVLVELTDRLARVRQRAWELVNSPDRSAATLRDLATIGIAVHAPAARSTPDPPDPPANLSPAVGAGKLSAASSPPMLARRPATTSSATT